MLHKERFEILRGYCSKNGEFHPQGGPGTNLTDLLRKLKFNSLDDFSNWYKALSKEEIDDGKKDWCSGDCCQSILSRLLKPKIVCTGITKK